MSTSASELVRWTKAGFQPTNNAFKGTGLGGTDIGAMALA